MTLISLLTHTTSMSELKIVNFIYFYFISYFYFFLFIFLFLGLKTEVIVILQTVSYLSYDHASHKRIQKVLKQ